jgi:hypothetical protein
MIQPTYSTRMLFSCLILSAVILSFGCTGRTNGSAEPNKNALNGSGTITPQKADTPTNLQLVLEGPFAIQIHLDGQPGKIKILIPNATDHFDPGFDADLDQHLLCAGDYSVDLPKHSPGLMTRLDTKSMGRSIQIDTVEIASVPESKKYIGVLIDSPDELVLLEPTTATINDPNGESGEYASKALLRYTNIDPSSAMLSKLTGDVTVCKITPKVLSVIPLPYRTKSISYPWPPSFAPVGSDVRLLLSMVPSVKDDFYHTHASASYKAIADMLGIKRTVTFPKPSEFNGGPHNDCRAPLILVKPLAKTP